MVPRLREFFRQGQTEVVSNSKNKILATWEPFFCRALYLRICLRKNVLIKKTTNTVTKHAKSAEVWLSNVSSRWNRLPPNRTERTKNNWRWEANLMSCLTQRTHSPLDAKLHPTLRLSIENCTDHRDDDASLVCGDARQWHCSIVVIMWWANSNRLPDLIVMGFWYVQ